MNTLEDHMAAQEHPHRFGSSPPFTVGVEEEVLLVDPDSHALAPRSEELVAGVRPVTGYLAAEIFAAEIELVTPVCATTGEAGRVLASLLSDVKASGLSVLGAGLHPTAREDEGSLCPSPRYLQLSNALRGLLRTPPAALHVHVGMPDPETAIRVANGLRRHLPLLHSLGANSPFWFGRDSGLASARTAILRSYPRYGVPRWFRDYEEFCAMASELATAAGVPDYTYFWWDVRPHPRLGTVEVRAPDAQVSQERSLILAALIHALVLMEAEEPPPIYEARETIEEACYQASRYGLQARLPDHHGNLRPAWGLALEIIGRVRLYARELGCEDEVLAVEAILEEGGGAELQRRIHAERGMSGLLDWLVAAR